MVDQSRITANSRDIWGQRAVTGGRGTDNLTPRDGELRNECTNISDSDRSATARGAQSRGMGSNSQNRWDKISVACNPAPLRCAIRAPARVGRRAGERRD